MGASLQGKSSFNNEEPISNISESSTIILKHTFFALAAIEFFKNGKDKIFADGIIVKDEGTGREFIFTLKAKEICH